MNPASANELIAGCLARLQNELRDSVSFGVNASQ